jgi:hypothetical protein
MTYQDEFIDKLANIDHWPAVERPDFLTELNKLADDVFAKKTVEGYLASLLIYHQLCEEMVKLLIACSTFYIQCAIFPLEIPPKSMKGKMFGQLLYELEQGVMSQKTRGFVAKCKQLNELRIKMVHRITSKTSIGDIERQTKKAKKIFDEIYELFDQIYDGYRLTFGKYRKDIDELRETLNESEP